MRTFVERSVHTELDYRTRWVLDKETLGQCRKQRNGSIAFFQRVSRSTSRQVVWCKQGRKVQRREYLRKGKETVLFVDYYPAIKGSVSVQ